MAKCLFVLVSGATDENSTLRKAPRTRSRDAFHLFCLSLFCFVFSFCVFVLLFSFAVLSALIGIWIPLLRSWACLCLLGGAFRRRASAYRFLFRCEKDCQYLRGDWKKNNLSYHFFFSSKLMPAQRCDLSRRLLRKKHLSSLTFTFQTSE